MRRGGLLPRPRQYPVIQKIMWRENNSGKNDPEDMEISRSKAKGVMGLMILLIAFQTFTFTLHKCGESRKPSLKIAGETPRGRFFFDPNTLATDSLQLLGLSEKQALAIIRYREKGGLFRKPEDFAKMYVISDRLFSELQPYIRIRNSTVKDAPHSPERAGAKPKRYGVGHNRIPERNNGAQKEKQTPSGPEGYRGAAGGTVPRDKTDGTEGCNDFRNISKADEVAATDLNEADSATLVAIRGIGPYFAREIIRYRSRLGSYASPEQLLEIRGMTEERFRPLRRYFFVHPSGIKKFSISGADNRFLKRHPYIGAYAARGISLFKEEYGAAECTLGNLVANGIIDSQSAEKLQPYMSDAQNERDDKTAPQ